MSTCGQILWVKHFNKDQDSTAKSIYKKYAAASRPVHTCLEGVLQKHIWDILTEAEGDSFKL